ncbi:MAG TPA: hypothetical protein VKX17_10480 [Planctomycetota bacterium]|nr:hypothetical protein [Planctomycetota bacterium]
MQEIVLRESPVQIRASLKDGVVQCRHPWLENKVLRFGVGKMTPADQTQFQAELQKLLDATPRHEHEVPDGVREEIKARYLKSFASKAIDIDLKASKQNPRELAGVQLALTEPMVDELSRENKRLRDQVESLLKATGMRGEAERNATMEGCWKRFEERFQCRMGSQKQERRNVLRRAKLVVEKIGWKTVYGSIEKADIEKAIDATKPVSETERSKRSVDIKRFFKFLCRPKAEDGFGFLNNPAQTLEYLSPKVLQRRRRGKGLVIAAGDPKELLPKLPLYWRTLYATLCYAGLRMAEAAALRWDRINFEKRVIGVLPTADWRRWNYEDIACRRRGSTDRVLDRRFCKRRRVRFQNCGGYGL